MRLLNKVLNDNQNNSLSFVSYITAGDPDISTSLKIMEKLVENGVGIIELGIPFSDPISDGPTIQKASERALKNKITIDDVLKLIKKFREKYQTPIILFGYYNPFLKYGLDKLMKKIKDAGADGILVVDLPPEESEIIQKSVDRVNLELIYLLAPTSTKYRIETISKLSNSFIYLVSVTGVTGARKELDKNLYPFIEKIRKSTNKPICVGSGISKPDHVKKLKNKANGIVIGSAFIKIIEENLHNKKDILNKISKFTKKIYKSTKI